MEIGLARNASPPGYGTSAGKDAPPSYEDGNVGKKFAVIPALSSPLCDISGPNESISLVQREERAPYARTASFIAPMGRL